MINQISITPVKVKLYDTVLANTLTVRVNNDNGTQCTFAYSLSNGSENLGGSSVKITDTDYANYVAANKAISYVLTFVATSLSLTVAS